LPSAIADTSFSSILEFQREREKERKRVSASILDNGMLLLTFRASHRKLDMMYEPCGLFRIHLILSAPQANSRAVRHPPFWDEHVYNDVERRWSARSDAGFSVRNAHSSVICLDSMQFVYANDSATITRHVAARPALASA